MAIDVNKLRTQWDSLSYAEQQQKLNSNSELRNAANQLGFTIKTNPEAQAVNKTQVSKVTSNKSNNNALVGTGAVASMPEQPTIYSGIDTHDYSKDQSIDTRRQNGVLQSTPAPTPSYSSVDTRRSNTSTYTPDPNYASVDTRRYQSTLYRSEDPNRVNTTAPKTTTTSQPKSTVVTPKQQEWDYQDNSQARMNQIADNLDRYKITNPELFKDYDSFYNFFIDGKGRSADQIRFLDNWYANYKKTEKYNNMSAEEVGKGIANGVIPEDYISTTGATDPDRADAIKGALEDAQDSIANESYLSELAGLSGFHAWNAKEMLYKDENNDGLDDRLYHEPTEEERKLVEENNEYEAERLKLNNAMKDLQSDLTEQYPDADLSTIMLLTSDRGNKIQKSLDTLAVSQTKVQGTLKYLQTERATMDKAGQNTIKELQDNYGMYMEYSPEGIMQMTQAKYAAENITLDQADSGNETQKQMALDKVLTGYYDKYGAIIQRSKDQVINDVIAYAKKNGTTLSEALEKNFLQYLRAKPEFERLNTLQNTQPDAPTTFKVGDEGYYWDGNNWLPITGASGTGLGAYTGTNNGKYTDYTPISDKEKVEGLKSFLEDYTDGNGKLIGKGGQCGTFVNNYLQSLGYDRLYTDPIDKKKAVTNSNTPTLGAVAVMDSKNYPQYGHVAIVSSINPDGTVNLIESNWGDDEKVHLRKNVSTDKIYGYFDPSIKPQASGNLYNPDLSTLFDEYSTSKDTTLDKQRFWSQYGKEIEGKGVSKDEFLKQYGEWYQDISRDAYLEILSNLDQLIELTGEGFDLGERTLAGLGQGDVGLVYDYIKNNLTVNGLQDARQRGLKLGVLSDSDVKMIGKASSKLGITAGQSTWNDALKKFRDSLLNHNKYLKQEYANKSAYSDNTPITYNSADKSFSIGNKSTTKTNTKTNTNTNTSTNTAPMSMRKDIKNLGK